MKHYIIIICSIMFASCNMSFDHELDTKLKEMKFQQRVGLDSLYISYPLMRVSQDKCCIADLDAGNFFFHIFTFPRFEHIASFCRKGHAKNELYMLTDFDFNGSQVVALCGADNTIHIFNIDEINGSDSTTVIKYSDRHELCSIRFGANNGFYAYDLNGDNRIVYFSNEGREERRMLASDNNHDYYPMISSNYIWNSTMSYNDSTKQLALGTYYGDVFTLVNIETPEQVNKETIGAMGKPEVRKERKNYTEAFYMSQKGYLDICFQSQHIYALFRGERRWKKMSEIKENSIRAFDYDGNLKFKALLNDTIESNSFYVDESTGYVYCTVPESEEPIWVFKL